MGLYSFIMPMALDGSRGENVKRLKPKYIWGGTKENNPLVNCVYCSQQAYAFANLCLIRAEMNEFDANLVAAQPDVWTVPDIEKMDTKVDTDQLMYLKGWLLLYKIPADGLTEGMTFTQVDRYLSGAIQTSQKLAHQRGFTLDDKTMDTKFSDLKADEKAQLDDLYGKEGYGKDKLNNAASLSEILDVAAKVSLDIPVEIAGVRT